MTRFALTCAALLAVQPAFAQSVQPETPEVIVAPQGNASSAGAIVVPLLTLLIVAAAVAK